MIQWAKFGQMARKGLRARPKSLKTMDKIATKAKKIGSKAKSAIKKDIKFAKQYPELTAATVAIGGLTGLGVAGLVKSQKKKNGK